MGMTKKIDISAVLAANVRSIRARHGWTQEELAEEAEVNVGTIARIEAEVGNPSLLTLGAVAAALGTTVADIATEGGTRAAAHV